MKLVIKAVWDLKLLSMLTLGSFVKKTHFCDPANVGLQRILKFNKRLPLKVIASLPTRFPSLACRLRGRPSIAQPLGPRAADQSESTSYDQRNKLRHIGCGLFL